MSQKIVVHEPYQTGYSYELLAQVGKEFSKDFSPDLTPKEMLGLGIFGGCYFTSIPKEFPASWFDGVVFSGSGKADATLNLYKTNASQPLKIWQK